MSFLTLMVLAIGVAMDAFAVAITSGAILYHRLETKHILKIGFYFGFFQAIMPLIGWLLGKSFHVYIEKFDHWIAFLLLLFLGGKMIIESFKGDEKDSFDPLNNKVLLFLAIATSIDALAVGISIAFFEASIITSIVVIGLVTFIISGLGVILGKNGGSFLKEKSDFIGGVILALIGTKILFEHLHII